MKRRLTLLALSLMLSAVTAFAQRPMDDENERRVRIVRGPEIVNVTDDSATINWATNFSGANHVRYRVAGSNDAWQSAYHQGGGTDHSLQLTGLQPGRTYEWQILTRDGDLRTSGQFQTARRDYREGDKRDDHDRDGYRGDDRDHGRDGDRRDGDRGYDARDYGSRVALYRASNRQGSIHLYTTNGNEQNSRGFHAEGNAGFILASQRRGTVPLYRMRGPNGDVLLTAGEDEIDKMRSYNYRDDGILGYVARTQMPGTQPFFRLVNQDGSLHFCTISERERRQFLRNGWQELGPAGYIWTQP
ncbi:MAG TPA: fibronectin type III domain-containing protein [Candidatus Angelobacter sp.]